MGFLGVVASVSTDGRTIGLVAGGLSDAFDYYEIELPEFSETSGNDTPVASLGAPTADAPDEGPMTPEERAAASADPPAVATQKAPAAAAAAAPVACSSSAEAWVQYGPAITLGGSFAAKVDTYNVLGVALPKGASLDMKLTVSLTGSISAGTKAHAGCTVKLKPLTRLLTAYPVPISFSFEPVATFDIDGNVSISNVGVGATAGIRVAGHLGLDGQSSFSANRIFEAGPLTPVVDAHGKITARVGGDVTVGPGAGTSNAGVIAGVGGTFYPVDGEFGPAFPVGDSRFLTCTRASVRFTAGVHVTAKAWLGNWDVSKTISHPALQGSVQYPGSPWHLPAGCQNAPVVNPGDDLLGDGVTKVSDSVGGGADQWGHVDGFAPGTKTWVLSTGLISAALGAPGSFASTDLGRAGDQRLSDMSGYPTHDAAYYEVSLIPTGDTLHVRYVFASEEYPEYVGSSFNDVMAVFVDGVNCATVPGTNTPIAVNTVNAGSNAQYFVDNSAGAAGYATSMDGLTVPLTCSVPVTPGKQVTVRIAAADASDHIYDSAVALLDKGIWTD
jgi:hypothetical protein